MTCLWILLALAFALSQEEEPPSIDVDPTREAELDARQKHFEDHARRAAPRDTFDVFTNPELVDAQEAELLELVKDSDFIIGLHHEGEAKAYPISVMGTAELGNDTIGGVPIAVSW